MKTSKSQRKVLQVAYEAACQALPPHRHMCSPKTFTQPQLLACLVLKEFSRLDYRGSAQHLTDHPDLRAQIEQDKGSGIRGQNVRDKGSGIRGQNDFLQQATKANKSF